jgi:hypothetical protein
MNLLSSRKAELTQLASQNPSVTAVKTRWVHGFALLLALCALFAVIAGAVLTSRGASAPALLQELHLGAGVLAGVLALLLCLPMRGFWWLLPADVVLEALLRGNSPGAGALHAFLAHLFFAGSVAMALVTSDSWQQMPEFIDEMPKLRLRSLSTATLCLVLIQIALGTTVRHKLLGAGLHITFALVVALAIVCLGLLVMNQCSQHATLRSCSIMLMVVAGIQVFLGFGTFIMRLMADESSLQVMIPAVTHVTTGSLTLAATVVLALQLRRNLRPVPAGKPAVV